jgi:hypothetical protein
VPGPGSFHPGQDDLRLATLTPAWPDHPHFRSSVARRCGEPANVTVAMAIAIAIVYTDLVLPRWTDPPTHRKGRRTPVIGEYSRSALTIGSIVLCGSMWVNF